MFTLYFALVAFTIASASEDLYPLSDAVIDLINSKQDSWTAGRNFPEDTPLELLVNLNSVVRDAFQTALPVKEHNFTRRYLMLPEKFDPRSKWPLCPSLNETRNQGACGSSWAVAVVESMTDRYCIRSNGQNQFHFSAEDLLACSQVDGCNGGSPELALVYFVTNGIVSGGNFHSHEGCRPYRIPPHCLRPGVPKYCTEEEKVPTPACLQKCQEGYNVRYSQDKKFGESAYTLINKEQNIMAELFINGPVVTALVVYEDFLNYKKGVYFHTWGKVAGYHAVKILGYGVENGVKYWLAANFWGDTWGDGGFFKIRRGVDECRIESWIVAGQPIVDRV